MATLASSSNKAANAEEGWSATDSEDGDSAFNVSITSRVIDTSKPGTYELTYSVEDSEGLSTFNEDH